MFPPTVLSQQLLRPRGTLWCLGGTFWCRGVLRSLWLSKLLLRLLGQASTCIFYVPFPHARAYGISVIPACRFIIMLLLIAFLQRRRLLTSRRILDSWTLPGLILCSALLSL